MLPPLFIGNNALSAEKITIPFNELKRHWHILGRTGKGKSKALEIFCRHIIDAQHPLVLLDGKGDLFTYIRAYCALHESPRRVVILDPTDNKWAVGINYLELIGETSPATLAEIVMEGLKKCFQEEDTFKAWLEEWLPVTLLPLIKAGMTLVEVQEAASMAKPAFRHALFSNLGSDAAREKRKFEELKAHGPHEASKITSAVRTRAALASQSDMAEAMFGQLKTTINWREIIDTDGIVLIRAHQHPKISRRLATLIGTTVIHQLIQAAQSRDNIPEQERRSAWVVCDEFQEFACGDFRLALTQMRSARLWFVLSNQELAHLEPVPGLRQAVIAECSGKLYFSISHEDAELTVHELFQEDIHANTIKDEITQTKFRPVETTREVVSESESESDQSATSESDSETFCGIDTQGEVVSSSANKSLRFEPFADLVGGRPLGMNVSGGSSQASSASHANSHGTTRGWVKSTGSNKSHGTTTAIVPWFEYPEFHEVSSRTYYEIQEVLERLKAWLMIQHPRRAQLKVGDRKTLPIAVRYVKEVPVDPEEIEEFVTRAMEQCARPLDEVLKEVRDRVRAYVASFEAKAEEEEKRAQAALEPPDRGEEVKPFTRKTPVPRSPRRKKE